MPLNFFDTGIKCLKPSTISLKKLHGLVYPVFIADCQFTLPVDSREAKEIEHAVRRLTWDTNNLDKAVSISHIKKVDNPGLEREYHEKKTALREEGRSPKELTQQLAFGVETEDTRVKEICRLGLECDGVNHTLGDGGMGVSVWKCPDLCLRALSWPTSGAAYLVVYKVSVWGNDVDIFNAALISCANVTKWPLNHPMS